MSIVVALDSAIAQTTGVSKAPDSIPGEWVLFPAYSNNLR
jgi:hypothetical protein